MPSSLSLTRIDRRSPAQIFEELCAKHGITASPAAFERITAVVKQLGMLELPAGAVNLDDPTDISLLNDLQLLLQM